MKKLMMVLGAVAAAFALGYFVSGQRWHRYYAAEIQRLQQEWSQQNAAIAQEPSRPNGRPSWTAAQGVAAGVQRAKPEGEGVTPVTAAAAAPGLSNPREVLARIRELHQNGGPNSQRAIQRLLGELVLAGPQSLEAIREFLTSGEGLNVDAQGKAKGAGGKAGALRQELLQVVQEIGGEQAEQLLAQIMSQAANPQEMRRAAQALEKMAPGKYQQAAIAAATAQLANAANNPGDIGPALEILGKYGDRSYVQQAQAMLVQPDGRLNKDALDYLQNVLRQDMLPLAAQLAQDPRITDARAREDLARLATEYVGLSEQANQMWYQSAINPQLADKSRERLIRELEKKGFENPKNPTPQDIQLAQVRLQILDNLRTQLQASPQVSAVDEARLRLAAMVDPNLRQNTPPAPDKPNKPNKQPR
jgi:uncharacterized protein (UPF0147 family)